MTRVEFEQLRDLPDKVIVSDIEFIASEGSHPNLVFDQVPVENSLGWDVVLNGTFKPEIPAIVFNFVLRGIGPICRVCVNGQIHGNAGRTHKHSLQVPEDTRLNLPQAVARPDLEGKNPAEVWDILCRQAKIEHRGEFRDPSVA